MESIQLKPTQKKVVEKPDKKVAEVSTDLKFKEQHSSVGEVEEIESLELKQRKSSIKSSTKIESESYSSESMESTSIQRKESLTVESVQHDAKSLSVSQTKSISSKTGAVEEATEAKKEVKKRRKIIPKEEEKPEIVQLKATPKKVVEKEEEVIEEISPNLEKYKGSDIGSGGVELDSLELKKAKITKPRKASKAEESEDAAPQVCKNNWQELRAHVNHVPDRATTRTFFCELFLPITSPCMWNTSLIELRLERSSVNYFSRLRAHVKYVPHRATTRTFFCELFLPIKHLKCAGLTESFLHRTICGVSRKRIIYNPPE